MEWYLKCLRHYADFRGRARRKEFWMFVLFNALISSVWGFVDGYMGFFTTTGPGILSGLYFLIVIIPSLAVCIRRLHDIGKRGWYYLIALFPIVGWIELFVWFCIEKINGEKIQKKNNKGQYKF